MTSSWTVKNECCKIRSLTLGHTMDLRGKLTVFKNLGCGAILGTRGESFTNVGGGNNAG